MPRPKKGKKSKQLLIPQHLLVNKILAIVLILVGLFVLVGFPKPAPSLDNPIQVDENLYKNQTTQNLPVRVLLPKENIDIPVTPSKIVNGYWEISETTASFGEGSAAPGQNGNTVIFAHAREKLFYNLKNTKIGDIVYVFTKSSWYRYQVNKITIVYPNQIEVIKPTANKTLTLYTCTGFSDEKRLIIQAVLLLEEEHLERS